MLSDGQVEVILPSLMEERDTGRHFSTSLAPPCRHRARTVHLG